MATRIVGKLTALKVQRAQKRGMLNDGAGLYLQIARGGTKSWVLRYKIGGRSRHLGLGPIHSIGLAEARARATEARRQLLDGHDPIATKHASKAAALLETAAMMTFDQCAAAYIEAHKIGWKNSKHADQWPATIKKYASPVIGTLPAKGIDTGHIMRVIEPIWNTKPGTANRLRGRIEAVLDWARVRGYRAGENPARWKGHLDQLLPARSKVRKVEHHSALPYSEIGSFMKLLREREGVGSAALEFAILTAARSGEVRGAKWDEIDEPNGVWVIPPARMKGGKEHRVPLSTAAIAVLDKVRPIRCGELIFPGRNPGKSLSENTLGKVIKLLGYAPDLVVAHGFRSTFRDWASEQTHFPNEVAEMALAHAVGNKVEAAYRRGALFEKRSKLMEAWGGYCARPPVDRDKVVVPLRA